MDVVIDSTSDAVPFKSTPLFTQGCYSLNLLACLGYSADNSPLGNFLKLYHQLEGQWLIVSPIHWQATHNDALIVAADTDLHLDENEARSWYKALVSFFKTYQAELIYHDTTHWLLKADGLPAISSKSLNTILHQSLMPVLSAMDKTFFWQRLLTESQMYLSNHPLNSQRQDKPINGVWVWGQGDFNRPISKTLITDDIVLLDNFIDSSFPLNLTKEFSGDCLIAIKQCDQLPCLANLKLRNHPIRWYWNDRAYLTPAHSWLSRLWRH